MNITNWIISVLAAAAGVAEPQGNAPPSTRPKLVVICVFDQMREEYLDRFRPVFGEGGFKRILTNGVRYLNCDYPYACTETGPGHASIASGRLPRNHGIIANEWFGKRMSQKGREYVGQTYCVEDVTFTKKVVNTEGAGETFAPSLANFRGENFSDRVRAEIPNAKIYSISYKDRSAILMAGERADGAFWFNASTEETLSPVKNTFISSTEYYKSRLPLWICDFMQREIEGIPDKWNLSVPPEIAKNRDICNDDNMPWEGGPGLRHQFPFPLRDKKGIVWETVAISPYSLSMTTRFAQAWIEREKLGQDDVPDVLWVSFSGTDYAGHAFGPDSLELVDVYKNADEQLRILLDTLDQTIPDHNYVVAVTADHGVCVVQENQINAHEGGGRFVVYDAVDRAEIEADLAQLLGVEYQEKNTIIARVFDSGWYFNKERLEKEHIDYYKARNTLRQILKRHPAVQTTYTKEEIENSKIISTDATARSVSNCYDPARSGDLIVVLKPFWTHLAKGGKYVATHGTPYRYDTHVPMLLFGAGVAKGAVADPVTPLDLVPTLSLILQIAPPADCDGRALPGSLAPGVGGAR